MAGGVLVGDDLRLVDARAQGGGARVESEGFAGGAHVELRVHVLGRAGGEEEGGARHVVGGLREPDEERCAYRGVALIESGCLAAFSAHSRFELAKKQQLYIP